MSRSIRLTGGTLAVLLTGCAAGGASTFPSTASARLAGDAPAQFAPARGEGGPDAVCRSPLRDPRDSTAIVLVRSARGVGDYEVPAGRYGVGERELLRLECGTARVLGIVRR
jgi:hypothetical protein